MNTNSQREHVLDDLKAYLDGQLGPAQRLAVRLHLARCPLCRKEMTTMEQIGTNLREGQPSGLDAALRARILAAIPAEEGKTGDRRQETGDRKRAANGWRRGLVLASGGLAVASLAIVVYSSFNMGKLSAPMAASSAPSAPSSVTLNSSAKSAGEEAAKEAFPQEAKKSKPERSYYSGGNAVATAAPNKSAMDSDATSSAKFASPSALRPAPGNPATLNDAAPNASAHSVAGIAASPAPASSDVGKANPNSKAFSPREQADASGKPLSERAIRQKGTSVVAADAYEETRRARIASGKPASDSETALIIHVNETMPAVTRVTQIAQSVRGYVIRDQRTTNTDASQTATLTLQVPATQINAVVSQIRQLGTLETQIEEYQSLQNQALAHRVTVKKPEQPLADGRAKTDKMLQRTTKARTPGKPPLTILRVTLTEKPK